MFSIDSFEPISIVIFIVTLGILPFVAIMVTSFVKLSIVISLVRNALGLQQVPPNMVINGLAVILTVYIMAPVGLDIYNILVKAAEKHEDFAIMLKAGVKAREPLRKFLFKHTEKKERAFFVQTTKALWQKEEAKKVHEEDLIILIPAFTVNELTNAFKIGFLVFLPFVIIDLIISNILLAMGMMMVSPMTISLPFKLLLFVLVDGWAKLIHGLVLTYR